MEHLLTNLKTAIFKVLEQMFFLLPDEDAEGVESAAQPVSVFIGISGKPAYRIGLTFDYGMAGTMTADLLGIDGVEPDKDMILKNLKETANIIGGNFLLSFDSRENRNVTLPSIDKNDIFGDAAPDEELTMSLSFDGRRMDVTLDRIDAVS